MSKKGYRPVVLITTGDPAGIGPEIIVNSLKIEKLHKNANFYVIGDETVYRNYSDFEINIIKSLDNYKTEKLNLIPVTKLKKIIPGVPTKSTAISAYKSLEKAEELIKKGISKVVVTAPIYKKGIISAGIKFVGHTEFFQERFNVSDVLMSFYSTKLFVGTITTHLPLSQVLTQINRNILKRKLQIIFLFFERYFNIKNPSIAVLGLNPHAGEEGALGNEEIKIIKPVCEEYKKKNKNVIGPISADVAFYEAINGKYNFILGMYHDQVLAPFKMLFFESGVNVTMGLPFVRTSPDHGTGFDIAGQGKANPTSMVRAIELALKMVDSMKKDKR
ncbi:MAG: 4-hydroxythreonine-4-phosphate dehydrogenase PdxA [Proteobacteria bacterium]|nr:4-hydroxythreonine-4-phosphate dehydrogenase PdxA [Pseudomonadota bacterium]